MHADYTKRREMLLGPLLSKRRMAPPHLCLLKIQNRMEHRQDMRPPITRLLLQHMWLLTRLLAARAQVVGSVMGQVAHQAVEVAPPSTTVFQKPRMSPSLDRAKGLHSRQKIPRLMLPHQPISMRSRIRVRPLSLLARTVGPRLPRFGAVTKADIRYVTHVVSCIRRT
jgi:hypothetical protein